MSLYRTWTWVGRLTKNYLQSERSMDMDKKYFDMQLVGNDATIMVEIVNQGIDSRLTGFAHSIFDWGYYLTDGRVLYADEMDQDTHEKVVCTKLHCNIAEDDMEVFIRRLDELSDSDHELADEAWSLLDDIVLIQYGHEAV